MIGLGLVSCQARCIVIEQPKLSAARGKFGRSASRGGASLFWNQLICRSVLVFERVLARVQHVEAESRYGYQRT